MAAGLLAIDRHGGSILAGLAVGIRCRNSATCGCNSEVYGNHSANFRMGGQRRISVALLRRRSLIPWWRRGDEFEIGSAGFPRRRRQRQSLAEREVGGSRTMERRTGSSPGILTRAIS